MRIHLCTLALLSTSILASECNSWAERTLQTWRSIFVRPDMELPATKYSTAQDPPMTTITFKEYPDDIIAPPAEIQETQSTIPPKFRRGLGCTETVPEDVKPYGTRSDIQLYELISQIKEDMRRIDDNLQLLGDNW